jgi:ketol-acid reductoisomerase
MTVTEVFEQAKLLSPEERKELAKMLNDIIDGDETSEETDENEHWGQSLNQLMNEIGSIELVDSHIEDPVEWVKAQGQKRKDKLKPYWDGDQ